MTDTYIVDSIFTIFLPVDGDNIESRFQVASRFLATPETNFYKQVVDQLLVGENFVVHRKS